MLLSVVFDMKLLFIVWRAKYLASFTNNAELRKRLTIFYVKFCKLCLIQTSDSSAISP